MPVLLLAVALLGLAVGSFLNVVIYRLPQQLSLSHPSSTCPNCGHGIRRRHNVPVLGWLILRGRCRDCQEPISLRYPLVEATTAALFVGLALQLNHLGRLAATPAYLTFGAIGIALSLIDFDVHRLPNAIVLPSYPVLALLLTLAAVFEDSPAALLRAVIGGVALYASYHLLMFAYPAGMGFGDVKLAGVIGAMLGFLSYQALLIGAFAAFLLGGIVGIGVIVTQVGSRKSKIPFGPFMFAGSLLAIFLSSPLSDLYSHLVLQT